MGGYSLIGCVVGKTVPRTIAAVFKRSNLEQRVVCVCVVDKSSNG